MPDILITVLMPCHNGGAYLREAIQSVLDQTFHDFEFLIINDGSTDGSVSIINSFSDPRIVLLNQKQQGIAAALNKGLRHSRAAYIARFDADDICYPGRLKLQYDFMLAHPDCMIVGSAADYIDATGDYVFTSIPPATLTDDIKALPLAICPFIHASVMYRKHAIAAVGYNINAVSFEDHLLWQMLKDKGEMYNLVVPLLKVRLNPGSITMDEKKRSREFHVLKNKVLSTCKISEEEGKILSTLISVQNRSDEKEGAYYSLLTKKFLWNNYDPAKARNNLRKALKLNAFDLKDYLLWPVSFLPKKAITILYSLFAYTK